MKLIFLDIDGVLNTADDFFESQYYGHEHNNGNTVISRTKLALLDSIIEDTGAKIVVSSTWRFLFKNSQIHEMFKVRGFKSPRTTFIGKTDDCRIGITSGPEYFRSGEIAKFLKDRDDVESYVILDDIEEQWFDKSQHDNLIVTDLYNGGLTYTLAQKAKNILGRTEESQKKYDEDQILLSSMIV
jgi:hypothetical protein